MGDGNEFPPPKHPIKKNGIDIYSIIQVIFYEIQKNNIRPKKIFLRLIR